MADREEIYQAIRNADAKGDSAAVRTLGKYLKTLEQQEAVAQAPKQDLTENMGTMERLRAGIGKGMTDFGRGVKQLIDIPATALEETFGGEKVNKALGMPTAKASAKATQEDIDESRRLDQDLMNTTAGKVGNVTGKVATAVPAMFIPGAQSLLGATTVGAAQGLAEPVATGESRAKNTAIGAAAGLGGVVAGRVVGAGVQGAKALVEPFYEAGRQRIAGRTLERFGVEAGDLAGVTGNPTVTGARTTLAEQIARPEGAAGAARLQDAMRSVDPKIAASMTAREAENNAARLATLKEAAGEGGEREFAGNMRSTAAKELYDKAFATKMDFSKLSAGERAEMTKLMNTPAVRDAMKTAKTMSENQMKSTTNQSGSVEGLHLMKLAMDDAIETAGKSGSAVGINKAMSIKMARDRLVSFIERVSPDYGEARATYAAMSKPLNQMDTIAEITKKGSSATGDLAGNARLMPDALNRAVQNEAQTIKNATGRDLKTTLADLLEPDQLAKVRGVAGETDRLAAVARAGNGPGSATGQRMASQNVLRQVLGPTGLPESWAESTMLNTAMRPVQFAYNGVAEPKIQQVIANLLLDPSKARAAIQAAKTNPSVLPDSVRAAIPYLEQALKSSVPATALAGQR